MNQNNSKTDTQVESQNNNIPVYIEPELTEALTPNPYLASLGISKERREEYAKQLAMAVMNPNDTSNDFHAQIPFMVTKGPFIKEDFLTINVSRKKEDGKAVIVLGLVKEPENINGVSYL
jgi:hypothetical protein